MLFLLFNYVLFYIKNSTHTCISLTFLDRELNVKKSYIYLFIISIHLRAKEQL